MADDKLRDAYRKACKNLVEYCLANDGLKSHKKWKKELPKLIEPVLQRIATQDVELRDAYRKSHANIVKYLVAGGSEPDPPDDAKKLDSKKYEDTLAEHLKPVLQEINNQLERKYEDKHVKIKKAIIQCNSMHPKVTARLRIPWKMSKKDWNFTRRRATSAILCLHPDRPTHILTEILLRLKPYPNQEFADRSRKDWVGILLNKDANTKWRDEVKDKYYVCFVEDWSKSELFSENMRDQLEVFREKNKGTAMVALGKEYPPPKEFQCVTKRVFNWFERHQETRNAFYLADLVDSEQLAGIAAELEIGEKTKISDINDFLKDCQWMMNRYVFSLILEAEKTYSGEGPSYPNAYFSYTEVKEDGEKTKTYEMINNLIDLFTPYDSNNDGQEKINERYNGYKFNKMGIIENLFKKIRIHFEITKGEMGKYAIGYKKHAYEVACVVAGIMDVLFYDKPDSTTSDKPGSTTSIETIVRQCSPGLEGIEKQLEDAKVPFLFRQLFKGLSKEDQLFLIPQYREHFIHSFYVFIFGVALMSYAPIHVIPPNLRLSRFGKEEEEEKKVKEQLKKWFLVSMWHDIAYMIEKGNQVLEQHVLSLMRDGRRTKGLLPWLPSLGNLLQVDKLLDEIRELSEGSIKLCPILMKKIKGTDIARRLTGDIVIAAAFERRDHGVWSAMMFNHAWAADMTKLYFTNSHRGKRPDELLKEIAKAIIPHHLADWDVRGMLKDYDKIKGLPDKCTSEGTMAQVAKFCIDSSTTDLPSITCNDISCPGTPVITVPYNGNEMGYLLGICDMISQAGREDTELPADTISDLGIQYKEIKEEKIKNGKKMKTNLSLHLKYKKNVVDECLFCKRYVQPSLFLGLTVCRHRIEDKAIRINITSDRNINPQYGYFYNPSLSGENE